MPHPRFQPRPWRLPKPVHRAGRADRGTSGLVALILFSGALLGGLLGSAVDSLLKAKSSSTEHPDTGAHALTGAPPTLAVVPLEAPSDLPDQLYLASGLTADLTTNLSRLSGLTVIGTSPTGTGTLGRRPPMAAARYRLLGEIQHRNDRIRLHLVVIETASGEQVWSRMYDRPFEEMTAIADESTADLAKALAVKVTEAEAARIRRRDTNSAEAYDLFLRAQSNLLVRRKEENLHARRLYSQALALDPAFARALGGIALTYAAEYRNRWASDGDSALALSKETAKQAAALNPELPEVLWVLAYVHVREGDHDSALGYLNRSIALDPSFADAYALKGSVMTYKGKPADAIQLLSRAMRLNPRAGYRYRLSLGRAFFYLEDNGHAIRNLREAAARNPANLEVRLYLAAALFHGGDQEAADWEALEIANLEADFSTSGWLRTHPIREPDQIERLTAALQGLGL